MAWCIENLRNCQGWYNDGIPISSNDDYAAEFLDAYMRQFLTWTDCPQLGGVKATGVTLGELYPKMLMGQLVEVGIALVQATTSIHSSCEFKDVIDNLPDQALQVGNEREQLYAKAVHNFAYGRLDQAAQNWEVVLQRYPNDLLAVRFACDTYFYLGDKCRLKECARKALENMRAGIPCSSILHSMYAFGLAECGEYELAEKEARLGLKMFPQDACAFHALAHCMEMKHQVNEGIKLLEDSLTIWMDSTLACHLFWHIAVFNIEKNFLTTALVICDTHVERIAWKTGHTLDVIDAVSALMRLHMYGVHMGIRFEKLLDFVKPRINDQALVFFDVHYRMVLSQCKDKQYEEEHRRSIEAYLKSDLAKDTYNRNVMEDIGVKLCEGISDFSRTDYDGATHRMFPVRERIYVIGGSEVQCDLFTLITVRSAFRSTTPEVLELGKICLDEREEKRKKSRVAQELWKLWFEKVEPPAKKK